MKPAPPATHAVPASTRDGWRTFEHRVLNRRSAGARPLRRRRPSLEHPVRDAIETWRNPARSVQFFARLITVVLAGLAAADLFYDAAPVRLAALIGAVF